jgi:hypothetical protein
MIIHGTGTTATMKSEKNAVPFFGFFGLTATRGTFCKKCKGFPGFWLFSHQETPYPRGPRDGGGQPPVAFAGGMR